MDGVGHVWGSRCGLRGVPWSKTRCLGLKGRRGYIIGLKRVFIDVFAEFGQSKELLKVSGLFVVINR